MRESVFLYQQRGEPPRVDDAPVVPDLVAQVGPAIVARRLPVSEFPAWAGVLDRRPVLLEGVSSPDRLTRPSVPPASGGVVALVDLRPHPLAQPTHPDRLTRPAVPPASGMVEGLVDRRQVPFSDASPAQLNVRTRPQPLYGTPEWGRADVVAVPDLVALNLLSPLPRPPRPQPMPLITPILDTQPLPGELTTTVVAGSAPCIILPSGMTPGDDTDG